MPPDVCCQDGAPLFPETEWWLTEIEKRRPATEKTQMDDDRQMEEEFVFCTPSNAHSVGSEDSSSVSDVESDASLPAGPRPRKLLRAGPKEPAADASDAGVGIVEPARAENRRRRRKSAPNSTSGSMIQAETLSCSADAVAELPSNLRRLAKSGAALLDVVG